MILTASVIIPTYNRPDSLRRLLQKLSAQDHTAGLEVLVVDDGSNGAETRQVCGESYAMPVRFFQQQHRGAAAARNLGAENSRADVLIFLDDDIVVEPGFVGAILREHERFDRAVVMGTFLPPEDVVGAGNAGEAPSSFHTAATRYGIAQDAPPVPGEVAFLHCVSHNFSIKRSHFVEIGCFQDPTGGKEWPNWDDIDIAYRAHCRGFTFRRSADARGAHLDYSLDSFTAHCQRIYRAGRSANYLFGRYPELKTMLPMFEDKTPINFRADPPRLAARKLLRALTAWGPVLAVMEGLLGWLERRRSTGLAIRQLYRWINSSYIYNGYRAGRSIQQNGGQA